MRDIIFLIGVTEQGYPFRIQVFDQQDRVIAAGQGFKDGTVQLFGRFRRQLLFRDISSKDKIHTAVFFRHGVMPVGIDPAGGAVPAEDAVDDVPDNGFIGRKFCFNCGINLRPDIGMQHSCINETRVLFEFVQIAAAENFQQCRVDI